MKLRGAMAGGRRLAATLAVMLAAGATGAADDDAPSWLPRKDRALFVCVAGDEATLSWRSEKGFYYTLLYSDKPTGQAVFRPLPGYVRMPGTGRTETLKFKVDPARPRRFNLRVEKQ